MTTSSYCLVLLNGPTQGASITLESDAAPLSIGREAARDFPIDDHQVSRLHARLWHDGGSWQIEDCGSRNGTRVNSQLIQRSVLQPGDLIRIGDRLIVFSQEAGASEVQGLRVSAFARSTCAIRVARPGKWQALLEGFGVDSASRPVRNLSLLCRLATLLANQSQQHELIRVVFDSLHQAFAEACVNIYLVGSDGRLRRSHGMLPRESGTSDIVARERPGDEDHLLASLAIERDEAMLIDAIPSAPPLAAASGSGDIAQGTAIGVPIPGRGVPRGAIECFVAGYLDQMESRSPAVSHGKTPADSSGDDAPGAARAHAKFDRADLELVVAVAQQLGSVLENLEHRQRLEQANEQLLQQLRGQNRLLGKSLAMRTLHDQISRVAPTDATVLVTGESGTGKELVSDFIHRLSRRESGPFVAVNCAAFSESLLESELFGHEPGAFTGADRQRPGQFERAHLGTIFLDEIGEMSLACQAKLLRLLEGHPFERLGGTQAIRVDLRIVAATHRDLAAMVAAGRFREDLFYRLRVIELRVPPLRERGSDAVELAVAFLQRFRRETGRGPSRFSTAALESIAAYAWPGNVRELKNAVERAVVLGEQEEIQVADLGVAPTARSGPARNPLVSLREAELQHVHAVLKAVDGNKTKACQVLGIGRGTLYKKLARQ